MNPIITLFAGLSLLVLVFAVVWIVQRRTHNAGMVDPVWSWSLGALGVFDAWFGQGDTNARIVLALCAGSWGLRLGTHLFWRNWGKPEDGRYRRFREQWGVHAQRNMFWFFQLQVVFAGLLSITFLVVANRTTPIPAAAITTALAIWVVSVAGEALADWQLERFKLNPAHRGQVCQTGLWRYSRHPNYFFESVHWLVYVVLAVGSPWWFMTFISPIVMTWLLLKVSGLPLTEAQTAKSRPAYAAYIETTSAFLPWPPKVRKP